MTGINLPSKLLIVDADQTISNSVKGALLKYNVNVMGAFDRSTALYQFSHNHFEVVIIASDFEEYPGLALIQKWRKESLGEKRFCGFILTIGNNQSQSVDELNLIKELQNIEVLKKPFTPIQLIPFISKVRQKRGQEMSLDSMKQKLFQVAAENDLEQASQYLLSHMKDLGAKGVEMLVELYEKNDNTEKALDTIESLLKKDKENIGWLNTKSRLLLKTGQTDKALEIMELADKAAPKNIERINNMAAAYLNINDPDKSVEKMRELIELSPGDDDKKFELFSKLYDHGFDEHSINLCKETTSPMEVVRHYNNKGVALSKNNQYDKAIEEYQRSLKFFPKFKDNYRIYYNISLAHINGKTPNLKADALEALEKCLGLKPGFDKAIKAKEHILGSSKSTDLKDDNSTNKDPKKAS